MGDKTVHNGDHTGSGDHDYEVGYGKPPRHSRWKAGQSGNPKGRKSGSRGLKKDLDQALKEALTIMVNGKKRRGTTQSHAMFALAVKAAAGDMRANKQLTDLVMAVFGPGDRGGEQTRLSVLDQRLLEQFLASGDESTQSSSHPHDPEP